MQGLTDTDEVRATVRKLTDALYEYLTLDVTAYERAAKAGQLPSYATMADLPKPPDPAEQLAKAVEERDRIQARLDKAREQLLEVPEIMRAGLEMAIIDPLQQNLESQERYVSLIQEAMEHSAPK
jgi:hypothetical protein